MSLIPHIFKLTEEFNFNKLNVIKRVKPTKSVQILSFGQLKCWNHFAFLRQIKTHSSWDINFLNSPPNPFSLSANWILTKGWIQIHLAWFSPKVSLREGSEKDLPKLVTQSIIASPRSTITWFAKQEIVFSHFLQLKN